jgi:hypothetical protein
MTGRRASSVPEPSVPQEIRDSFRHLIGKQHPGVGDR